MRTLIRHCRVLQHHCRTHLCRTVVRNYASGQLPQCRVVTGAAGGSRAVQGSQLLQQQQQQQQSVLQPELAGTFHVSLKELVGKGKVRLDTYLLSHLPTASRAKISATIKAGLVLVNGAPVGKPSQLVRSGDVIAVSLLPPEPCTAIPEAIPLDVVYEDKHLIVVNKAAGMVVHLSPGHSTGTLVNALLAHCGLPPCVVACGSASSSDAAAAAAAGSVGGGLLSAAGAAAVALPGVAVIGGMVEDEWELGEDEAEYGSSDDETSSSSSSRATGSNQAARHTSSTHRAPSDAAALTGGMHSANGFTAGTGGSSSSSNSSSSSSQGIIRPGIVHRLDRGTSGLMVVAKTDYSHAHLCGQFKERSVSRIYNAITLGVPNPPAARIATNITRDPGNRLRMIAVPYGSSKGRTAASKYRTLQVLAAGGAALVEWRLETGRTHQIRVHARHVGNPLLGDDLYGPGRAASAKVLIGKRSSLLVAARAAVEGFARPALHAKTLGFMHPATGERLEFDSEWPDDFVQLYQQLGQWC